MEKTTSLKDLRKTSNPEHISVIVKRVVLVLEAKRVKKTFVDNYPRRWA